MFPLYDSLKNGITLDKMKLKEKKELVSEIKSMDSDACEILYILMYCYSQDKKISFSSMYDMKNNEIEVDLKKIPNDVCQLLYRFSKQYVKKVQEDKSIEELKEAKQKIPKKMKIKNETI